MPKRGNNFLKAEIVLLDDGVHFHFTVSANYLFIVYNRFNIIVLQ